MTDLPVLDIQCWNNERFQMSRDVSGWAGAYDLGTAAWRLQVRKTAATASILLAIPTSGSVAYAAGVVIFSAAKSVMAKLKAGDYVYDYGFTPVGGDFIRCEGGLFRIEQGVTR